jgi:hypothetical protein
MTVSTKWYATKTGITMGTGSTLTIASGATLAATGWVASTGALTSMTCTGAATVGTTLGVTGNLTVNTDALVVTASTGVAVAKGNVIAGLVASGKAIILSPAGARVAPGTNNIQIFTDGTDVFAARNADTKTSKMSVTWV